MAVLRQALSEATVLRARNEALQAENADLERRMHEVVAEARRTDHRRCCSCSLILPPPVLIRVCAHRATAFAWA
jgi:hypothetical protein